MGLRQGACDSADAASRCGSDLSSKRTMVNKRNSGDNAMATGYFTHRDCWLHDMGPVHPECAARLDAIEDRLL